MTPPASASDVAVALFVALVVILVFVVMNFAQNRRPLPAATTGQPPPGATEAGLTGLGEGMTGFESRITMRLGQIEERQKSEAERLKQTEHDVRNIRTSLAALPSKDAVHRLEVELTALRGQVGTLDTVGLATQRSVDRILNHLLKDAP